MLPERHRQLLTAYVDGELSGRQQRQVNQLLQQSPEARALLALLQQDSCELAALPVSKLDRDLSEPVLQTIQSQRLKPGCRQSRPVAQSFPTWVGVAAAAAIMCMIGLTSYAGFSSYFSHPTPSRDGGPVAQEEPKESPSRKADPLVIAPKKNNDVARTETPSPREFVGPPMPEKQEGPVPPVIVKGPSQPEIHGPPLPDTMPVKEEPLGPVFTDRAMERFEPEMVVGKVRPVILTLHELDQDEPRKKLFDELMQDPGFRLDFPCKNGTLAFDRLQAACREQKITVLIDQKAQQRLKTPTATTHYVLYIENIAADELTRLVQQIGAEDKRIAAKKPLEACFDRVVVTRLTSRDYKELSDLLNVDQSKVEPPKTTESPTDQPRPLTGDKSPRQALVLAYNPVLPTKNSPEVKRFLDARKPAKPDTVRAIIVLRGT